MLRARPSPEEVLWKVRPLIFRRVNYTLASQPAWHTEVPALSTFLSPHCRHGLPAPLTPRYSNERGVHRDLPWRACKSQVHPDSQGRRSRSAPVTVPSEAPARIAAWVPGDAASPRSPATLPIREAAYALVPCPAPQPWPLFHT